MNIETTREFLGWCTVINLGLLTLGLVKVLSIRDWATGIHAKMFGRDEASVRLAYFQFFANCKIAVVVFNLGPYIALRIMSGS